MKEIIGEVIYDGKSDYHIIETNGYYVVAEWFSGPDLSIGDKVSGNLHSCGYQFVKINNHINNTKIYVEDYWGIKEKCFEWLKAHNKLK